MLPIVEMFESIQGEGSMTGTPSFFVRLAGCNLKCLHPDSLITMGDFSQKPIRKLKPGDEVLGVEHKHPNNQYVVKQRVKRVWTKEGVAIKISFPSGNLTCSEDHRIYSFRRHGYAYAKNVNNANLAVLPKSNTIRVLNKEKASVSTVPCYEGVLYEIETEKGNYFAENVLVHNCEWCDTDHREQYKLHPEMLLEMIQESKMPHVVVTGGEPTIHDELFFVATEITKTGKTVQIETNGKLSYPVFGDPEILVTVSPKTPEFQRRRGHELKVVWNPVIWTEMSLDHLMSTTDFKYYYLQPLWKGRESNIDQVIKQLLENPSWRLSLQTHKYIGVR